MKVDKLNLPEITAADVRDTYVLCEGMSSTYRYQMAEDEEFFLGHQLTLPQKQYLLSVGQPPESNNKIRPAVETVLANISASSPEWDCDPMGKGDEEFAYICNSMLDRIWEDSDGSVQYRQVCKDYIVKGLAFLFVYPDWNADEGLGGMRMKRIPPEAMFVDANSMLPDFSDAAYIIYSDLHTKESMKVTFPRFKDIIEEASSEQIHNEQNTGKYDRDDVWTRADIGDNYMEKVRKYVYWTKVNVPFVRLTDLNTGHTQIYNRDQYLNELQKDEQYKGLLKKGVIDEEIIYRTQIREVFVIGDEIAYDEVLPITRYPVIPACNEHTGTPFPAGDVRHAKSPQRMLNRTEALLISHTSATTNFKLLYEDGAIDAGEVSKWHIPNALIRVNPGALREQKIKEFAPPAISGQLFQEKARYEMDIEQVFGAYKYMQGSSADAPGTVGEAQIIDEAVARKQNWKVLPIYDALVRAAKIVLEWVPIVYDQQRTIRIINPDGSNQEVTMNKPVWDEKKGSIVKLFDMASVKLDVSVVIGSTRAKSPQAKLQKDLMLLQAGIYDKTQVILNMPGDVDKASLMARVGEIQNLQAQIQQLSEENEKLKGDMQTRERELFHSNMRAEISEATKPVAKAQAKLQSQMALEGSRTKDKTAQAAMDLKSVVDTANATTVNSNQQAPTTQMGVG
tara:strand:- start:2125 stop:4161 length:2037 start_codon:yes stop_codon:yes gene_type:complete